MGISDGDLALSFITLPINYYYIYEQEVRHLTSNPELFREDPSHKLLSKRYTSAS